MLSGRGSVPPRLSVPPSELYVIACRTQRLGSRSSFGAVHVQLPVKYIERQEAKLRIRLSSVGHLDGLM
jgi:hypothetical protein